MKLAKPDGGRSPSGSLAKFIFCLFLPRGARVKQRTRAPVCVFTGGKNAEALSISRHGRRPPCSKTANSRSWSAANFIVWFSPRRPLQNGQHKVAYTCVPLICDDTSS